MTRIPWLLIIIFGVIILLGVLVYFATKGKKTPPDYYLFFIMGICWAPMGIATSNHAFTFMGIAFMIIGLVNKDKWKENRRSWVKMGAKEKRIMTVIMVALGLLVIVSLVVFLISSNYI